MAIAQLIVLDRLARLAETGIGLAQIAEMDAFALPVRDLAGDGDRPLRVPDPLARIAGIGIGIPQIGEAIAFALPVTDLAGDGERLLMVLDRRAHLAEAVISNAQITKTLAFTSRVVARPASCHRRLKPSYPLSRMQAQRQS